MNRAKPATRCIQMTRLMLGGALVLLSGCTSIDGRNSDVQPWNRPAPPPLGTTNWPWWASWWASVYEEQAWLRARQGW